MKSMLKKKSFYIKTFVFLLAIIGAGYGGFFYGTNTVELGWKNFRPIANVESKAPPTIKDLDLSLLHETIEYINSSYYDKSKIDSQQLLFGAVSGLLSSLNDPYTSFFPPAKNEEFKEQLAGEFSGIGAELSTNEDKRIIVVAPLDGSPAERAGIKPGDMILGVDGQDITGWTLAEAVENIRGPKGTEVKLTILHENSEVPMEVTIVRDAIIIKSVRGWIDKIDCSEEGVCKRAESCETCPSIAYIRLSQFGDKTNQEWVEKVNEIFPQILAAKNFQGLVLDLRNNPGGYLNDAVFIASEFIENGLIVAQEDGNGNREELNVTRKGILTKTPTVVLINEGSASASEIVSGALRDRRGIPIMGANSFGKGTIQSAIDVQDGASIHLTIAKWVTPNNVWVHDEGLKPDIEVLFDASESAKLTEKGGFDNQLQETLEYLLR